MHEAPICWNGQSFSVFVFVFDFHCQIKWICLIAAEWGLWNNSWVKNLPVRPLAPRRKTPGQLYPAFNDLPGWVRNILKPSTCFEVWYWLLLLAINNYDFINTKPSIHCKLTLMVPSSSYTSLFTLGFWTPALSYGWVVDRAVMSHRLFFGT